MTALRQVQEERPTAIPTIELVDLTEVGAPMGFKCRIAMFPKLVDLVDGAATLERLRDALLVTEGDRALALMRGVVLLGERVRMPSPMAALEEGQRFVTRARAGIGGPSESGRMLALQVEGRRGSELLLFLLQLTPTLAFVHREPTLVITSLDGVTVDPLLAWVGESPLTRR
jgi:hypothetical protein